MIVIARRAVVLAGLVLASTAARHPAWPRETAVSTVALQQPAQVVLVRHYDRRRQGDWRVTFSHWTSVTVYYRRGRYYDRPYLGAKPVAVYRYHGQTFTPPTDAGWTTVHGGFVRPG